MNKQNVVSIQKYAEIALGLAVIARNPKLLDKTSDEVSNIAFRVGKIGLCFCALIFSAQCWSLNHYDALLIPSAPMPFLVFATTIYLMAVIFYRKK